MSYCTTCHNDGFVSVVHPRRVRLARRGDDGQIGQPCVVGCTCLTGKAHVSRGTVRREYQPQHDVAYDWLRWELDSWQALVEHVGPKKHEEFTEWEPQI